MAKASDTFRAVLVPIHRAGWPFLAIAAVITLVLTAVSKVFFWPCLILTAWVAYFFRDPERHTPQSDDLVITPADGVVQSIERAVPPAEMEMGEAPLQRVAVFMNVFDVHINRSPVKGTITKKSYRPGLFLNASLDKASVDNERMSYRVTMASGEHVVLVQIAGLVARRIVAFSQEDDPVEQGQRVGLIRFGSRCDIYLPDGFVPTCLIGQRMVAGETILARRGAVALTGRSD